MIGAGDNGAWRGWAVEGPRLRAMMRVMWSIWRAVWALRRYAAALERAQRAEAETLAKEAERLGMPTLAAAIRKGDGRR